MIGGDTRQLFAIIGRFYADREGYEKGSFLTLRFVDTHTHLDFEAYDGDRSQVLAAGREAGVRGFLNPGVDADSSRKTLALTAQYEGMYAGIGVHPNSAQTWQSDTSAILNHLADAEKVVAIGEIGLDYYRQSAPHNLQMQVFQAQLCLAAEKCLPVIIHNRDAFEDAYDAVREWHQDLQKEGSALAEKPGVFHAFSGGVAEAEQVVAMNFYIGITGVVTYPNAEKVRQVVQAAPLERLLLETDAPFLAPQEKRGSRNEPAYVRWTAGKIAELRGLSLEDVAEATTNNAERLFNLERKH